MIIKCNGSISAKFYSTSKVSISASPESSQPAELSQEDLFLADDIYAEVEQGKWTVVEPDPSLTAPPATEPEHSASEPGKEKKHKVGTAEAASYLPPAVLQTSALPYEVVICWSQV